MSKAERDLRERTRIAQERERVERLTALLKAALEIADRYEALFNESVSLNKALLHQLEDSRR